LDILQHHLSDRYERIRFRAAAFMLSMSNVRKFVGPPEESDDREGEAPAEPKPAPSTSKP
jgi:hypothetical protein